MMHLTSAALKDLAKLDKPAATKAKEALKHLSSNPKAGHTLEGSLKGALAVVFKVMRTDYRITYTIDRGDIIVFAIGSHENFYKLAARRSKQIKDKQ
jgi:mRNA-degrading endonuclease RelE of RelBE toxin-antitoxin system